MNDIRGVFDAFLAFSDQMAKAEAQRRLREDIAKAEARKCGNCDHWMKSSLCPLDDQRKGFPSCNHGGCPKYLQSTWAAGRVAQLRAAVTEGATR